MDDYLVGLVVSEIPESRTPAVHFCLNSEDETDKSKRHIAGDSSRSVTGLYHCVRHLSLSHSEIKKVLTKKLPHAMGRLGNWTRGVLAGNARICINCYSRSYAGLTSAATRKEKERAAATRKRYEL